MVAIYYFTIETNRRLIKSNSNNFDILRLENVKCKNDKYQNDLDQLVTEIKNTRTSWTVC